MTTDQSLSPEGQVQEEDHQAVAPLVQDQRRAGTCFATMEVVMRDHLDADEDEG